MGLRAMRGSRKKRPQPCQLGRLPGHEQNLPTLLISKTPAFPDVVRALNAGADDIVPLSTPDQELASKATAVLRRTGVILLTEN